MIHQNSLSLFVFPFLGFVSLGFACLGFVFVSVSVFALAFLFLEFLVEVFVGFLEGRGQTGRIVVFVEMWWVLQTPSCVVMTCKNPQPTILHFWRCYLSLFLLGFFGFLFCLSYGLVAISLLKASRRVMTSDSVGREEAAASQQRVMTEAKDPGMVGARLGRRPCARAPTNPASVWKVNSANG